MAKWKQSGNYSTVEDFLLQHGLEPHELINPHLIDPSEIENLTKAADIIVRQGIWSERPIYIVGDYDVDGITATAILVKLLKFFLADPIPIIPKRFTDGYGISEALIQGIEDSLIITVDNGISAAVPIAEAKRHGNLVVVLDHHLPVGELPEADVLVDPHIHPENNGFVPFCGAGLAYMLARYIAKSASEAELAELGNVQNLFGDITLLAAIGTIADVMPMVGSNRWIIKHGLAIANGKKKVSISAGLAEVIKLADFPFDEDSVKFKIAPILNAPGRLYNAGSTSTLKALLCEDQIQSVQYAEAMKSINEDRKRLVSDHLQHIMPDVQSGGAEQSKIKLIMAEDLPEGLTGIVASKVADQTKCPAFVLTRVKSEPGLLKGSGRSYGNADLSGLIPYVKDMLVSGGGHAGAAGISVMEDKLEALRAAMEAYMEDLGYAPPEEAETYDIVIHENDVKKTLEDVMRYAPYGEGVPKPIFMLSGMECIDKFGCGWYRLMGADKSHLKLFGSSVDAIAFHMANEYQAEGCPACVDLIGSVGTNTFNGVTSLQFSATALRKIV